MQRDFGNRDDRKLARLKYLIANWGLEQFKAKVEEYYGRRLPTADPDDVHGFDDHMGWHEQGDGRWFYGLNVENGRIKDNEQIQLKTAIREICHTFHPGIRLTVASEHPVRRLAAAATRPTLEEILRDHRRQTVATKSPTSAAGRWPASPGRRAACRSPRASGPCRASSTRLEVELAKLGLSNERFTVRMTGCPNGCAGPTTATSAWSARPPASTRVFLGGRLLGDRLNFIYKDMVPDEEVVATLVPVFAYFKHARTTAKPSAISATAKARKTCGPGPRITPRKPWPQCSRLAPRREPLGRTRETEGRGVLPRRALETGI